MNNKVEISIDFAPNVQVRWGHGKPANHHIEVLFNNKIKEQINFLDKSKELMPYLELISVNQRNEFDPFWNNGWFPPFDGITLYTMIANKKPGNYIEIGSGNSTKFANRAVCNHELSTKITSIDPFPRAEIDAISDVVVRKGLEDVDLTTFDQLSSGDVIFFDGSHRSFQNSDVTVFFCEILPRIPSEVIVGIHDIFLPNDYPPSWLDRYYNEQYILAAYIIAMGDKFDLIIANNFMQYYHSQLVNSISSELLKSYLSLSKLGLTGGCLWFYT